MTTPDQVIANIREALEAGPYEGPWTVEEFQHDGRPCALLVSAGGTIIAEIRGYIDSCGNGENARFIAACNPQNIAVLLAALQSAAETPAPAAWLCVHKRSGKRELRFEAIEDLPFNRERWDWYPLFTTADYSKPASNYNPDANLIGGESTAAETPAPSSHVRVKPLEWKAVTAQDRKAEVANSVLGKWEVWQFPIGGGVYIIKPGENQGAVYEDSYDEAKAYMERVYQRRMAPALAATATEGQP